MLVHQILKSKGTDGVVTVKPGTRVSQAAEVLSQRRIGTVVVSPDCKHVSGVLSERDIVREIGKRGAACLADLVDDMMTSKIETASMKEDADGILHRMTEGRFRHMPVMENGEMVGLITLGDVVKARLSQLAMEKEALEGMIMGH
jgi:CBS domain-containing protein